MAIPVQKKSAVEEVSETWRRCRENVSSTKAAEVSLKMGSSFKG